MDYAKGIYFNQPHERAPDFVLGSLSVKPQDFIDWLKTQKPNEKGYVKLKINRGRDGKPYVALDDWKPKEVVYPDEDINPEDVPF